MDFSMREPCDKCPFRKDRPAYLRAERAKEICRTLLSGSTFTCHQTTVPDEEDEEMTDGPNAQHCAGALIFLEKQNAPNQLMRIAERIGKYHPKRLRAKGTVFASTRAMVEAQPDFDEEPEGETCAIVGSNCEAPAGYMINGAVVHGDVFVEGQCSVCGEPCCDSCMNDAGICESCSPDEEE